jgi:hypothetical protein
MEQVDGGEERGARAVFVLAANRVWSSVVCSSVNGNGVSAPSRSRSSMFLSVWKMALMWLYAESVPLRLIIDIVPYSRYPAVTIVHLAALFEP